MTTRVDDNDRRRSNGALFVFADRQRQWQWRWRKLRWHLASFVPHGILMTILSHDVVLWTMEVCVFPALLTCSPPHYCHAWSTSIYFRFSIFAATWSRHVLPDNIFTATWMTVESSPPTLRSMKHVLLFPLSRALDSST